MVCVCTVCVCIIVSIGVAGVVTGRIVRLRLIIVSTATVVLLTTSILATTSATLIVVGTFTKGWSWVVIVACWILAAIAPNVVGVVRNETRVFGVHCASAGVAIGSIAITTTVMIVVLAAIIALAIITTVFAATTAIVA
jgi:hypothetical protein